MSFLDLEPGQEPAAIADENDRPADLDDRPLFDGDYGKLPLAARRVLIRLLAGPFLEAKQHVKLWRMLMTYEQAIRSRLSELFLELIIDQEQQIAFTRQADTGELETAVLLRKTRLTFIESILYLYLRQLLSESDTQNERAVVSEDDMSEQLMPYQKTATTDQAGFKKRINAAIENSKKRNILVPITGSKDRYEISPILKLLFGAEEVIALKQQYQRLLDKANQPLANADELNQDDIDE